MKLNQILPTLTESYVDPTIVITLDRIIQQGKLGDTFQVIVIARLLEFFKNGGFAKHDNFYDPFVSTPKALLDTLRHLDPKDAVALTIKLKTLLTCQDSTIQQTYTNPNQDTIDWINYATSRDAND